MCMEGVRIGRKTRQRKITTALTTASTQILPPNPRRFAVFFGQPNTSTAWFSPENDAGSGRAFGLTSTSPPVWLNITLQGDMVRGPWYAAGAAAIANISIIEIELADD